MIAQAIVTEGMCAIDGGANPVLVKRGVDVAVGALVQRLQAVAHPVSTEADFGRVAAISAKRSVPLFLRRALTMLPALIVLAVGLPPTTCLVLSKVVLSFGVPFALVPLVALTRRADVTGALVNRRLTTLAAGAAAGLIIAMNTYLLATAL